MLHSPKASLRNNLLFLPETKASMPTNREEMTKRMEKKEKEGRGTYKRTRWFHP